MRPRLGARKLDWLVGGRIAKSIDGLGTAGLAYRHRRDRGRLYEEELALDLGGTPVEWLDLAAGSALDLVEFGISEIHLSAATRRGGWRYELFASHRSPSRLLPATSLFSVLGDVASQKAGTEVLWRAAPCLDLRGTAALRYYSGDLGHELALRSTLRLDALGKGALGLELRRQDAPETGWSGARATGRIPVGDAYHASAELELVVPDQPDARGSLWPWGLVAFSRRWSGWETAAAIEASTSPIYSYEITGLIRLARIWGGG